MAIDFVLKKQFFCIFLLIFERFVRGEIIVQPRKFPIGIYLIIQGRVQVSHRLYPSVPIMIYSSGLFFGERLVMNERFKRQYK